MPGHETDESPSRLIDRKLEGLGDWRGALLFEGDDVDDDAFRSLVRAAADLNAAGKGAR